MTKKNKIKKDKKFVIRRFVKEIKRVRWPDTRTNITAFIKIVLFSLIFTFVVVCVTTLLTMFWGKIGLD